MTTRLVTVLLAFGANLGERAEAIDSAQRELAAHSGIFALRASSLVETVALRPDGPDPQAPRYLNGVALAETELSPHALLDVLQDLETRHGRTRGEPWADRTLDIDLIQYGGRSIRDDRLTVPHPRAHEREFVLGPWLELDPDAVLIGHGRVSDLLARVHGLAPTAAQEVSAQPSAPDSVDRAPEWGAPHATP